MLSLSSLSNPLECMNYGHTHAKLISSDRRCALSMRKLLKKRLVNTHTYNFRQ